MPTMAYGTSVARSPTVSSEVTCQPSAVGTTYGVWELLGPVAALAAAVASASATATVRVDVFFIGIASCGVMQAQARLGRRRRIAAVCDGRVKVRLQVRDG